MKGSKRKEIQDRLEIETGITDKSKRRILEFERMPLYGQDSGPSIMKTGPGIFRPDDVKKNRKQRKRNVAETSTEEGITDEPSIQETLHQEQPKSQEHSSDDTADNGMLSRGFHPSRIQDRVKESLAKIEEVWPVGDGEVRNIIGDLDSLFGPDIPQPEPVVQKEVGLIESREAADYNIYYTERTGERVIMEDVPLSKYSPGDPAPLDHIARFLRDSKCFDSEIIEVSNKHRADHVIVASVHNTRHMRDTALTFSKMGSKRKEIQDRLEIETGITDKSKRRILEFERMPLYGQDSGPSIMKTGPGIFRPDDVKKNRKQRKRNVAETSAEEGTTDEPSIQETLHQEQPKSQEHSSDDTADNGMLSRGFHPSRIQDRVKESLAKIEEVWPVGDGEVRNIIGDLDSLFGPDIPQPEPVVQKEVGLIESREAADYNIYYTERTGERVIMEDVPLSKYSPGDPAPLDHIARFLRDSKCFDSEIIEVSNKHRADHVIVASVHNTRHMRDTALTFSKMMTRDYEMDATRRSIGSTWSSFELGHCIVHFMLPVERARVNLESFWLGQDEEVVVVDEEKSYIDGLLEGIFPDEDFSKLATPFELVRDDSGIFFPALLQKGIGV
eukprot:sb/3463092/